MKDLFKHIEKLPIEMQEICNRFNLEISENGCTYENVNEFLKDCINLGYIFDYDLSAEPYNLRKLNITIYDNFGKSFDNITIVLNNEKRRDRNNKFLYTAIASSETGAGVFMHTEVNKGRHLGTKIKFSSLTNELQNRLINYFND